MKGLEICIFKLIIFIDFKPQITKIIEILVHFRFSLRLELCKSRNIDPNASEINTLNVQLSCDHLSCAISCANCLRTLAPYFI